MAMVADTLKPLVANLGALLERQLGILIDERLNGSIPANLVAKKDLGNNS